ncbi:MAG: hypothetical protein V9F03_07135 [Microthrixaceae bacterium]
MSITDSERYALYKKLESTIGPDHAAVLMEHLPPVGWADVATKHDLQNTEVALRGDLELTETAIRGDMRAMEASESSGDMKTMETSIRGDMKTMEATLRAETAELKAQFYRALRNQTVSLITAQTAMLTVMLAVIKLF